MAISDTITSMQTHTSNAYTMIGYGTDLTGINKNLENLSTSIFKAFLESLNNPSTLFNNLPKITGTGSNITLNNTANAPMRIMLNATDITQETNLYQNGLEQGSIYNGSETTGNNRVRTIGYIEIVPNTNIAITFGGVEEYTANYYNSSKEYITASSWTASGTDISVIPNAYYMRLTFRNSDNSAITPSSVTNLQVGNVPNPNYPQDIHTISGDNKVVVNGNNIFNGYAKVNSTFTNSIATALQHFKDTGEYAVGYPDTPANNKLLSSQLYMTAFIPVHEGITYTAVPYLPRTANYNFAQIFFLDDNGNIISYSPRWTEVAYTHTVASNEKYMLLSMRIDETYPINTTAEVVIGATAPTSYEPYISQEAEIDLGVENLIDGETVHTSNGITTMRLEDGGYKIYGIATSTYAEITNYFNCNIPIGTYIFSIIEPISKDLRIAFLDSNNVSQGSATITAGNKTTTTTTTADIAKARLLLFTTQNAKYDFTIYPQLEKGSTAHEYTEPGKAIEYCKMPNTDYKDQFIRTSGKNLFDGLLEAGTINASGNNESSSDRVRTINYIPVIPGQSYYLSSNFGTIDSSVNSTIYGRCYDKNKTYVSALTISKNGTFTIPDNIYYFRWQYIVGSGNQTTAVNTHFIMLNEGTTALPYEPYGTDKWYIKDSKDKVMLDTLTFETATSSTSGYVRFRTTDLASVIAKVSSSSEVLPMMSNCYIAGSGDSSYNRTQCISVVASGNIFIYDTDYAQETVANFMTHLTSIGAYLYYPLATPTYTQITGTLAEQLEYVYQLLKSYKGVTNISQVNNDLPFELDVQAIEDL